MMVSVLRIHTAAESDRATSIIRARVLACHSALDHLYASESVFNVVFRMVCEGPCYRASHDMSTVGEGDVREN
jgi:hypothetical protein